MMPHPMSRRGPTTPELRRPSPQCPRSRVLAARFDTLPLGRLTNGTRQLSVLCGWSPGYPAWLIGTFFPSPRSLADGWTATCYLQVALWVQSRAITDEAARSTGEGVSASISESVQAWSCWVVRPSRVETAPPAGTSEWSRVCVHPELIVFWVHLGNGFLFIEGYPVKH